MELKEKARARETARYFALDTLRVVVEWVKETNPQGFMSKEMAGTLGESFQAKIRDWVDRSDDLITKTWVLPELLVEDAVRVLREVGGAKEAGASES